MEKIFNILEPHLNSAELNIVQGANVAKQSDTQSFFKKQAKLTLKLFLSLVLLCCITIQSSGFSWQESSSCLIEENADHIIVIEGDILRTDSENATDPIERIEISDSNAVTVYDEKACMESSCETDVSQLNAGIYFIKITTLSGAEHSSWATKL